MNSKSLKILGTTFLVVVLFTYKLRIEGHESYTKEKHADKPTHPMKISQNEESNGKSGKYNEKHNAIDVNKRNPEHGIIKQDNEKNDSFQTDFLKKTKNTRYVFIDHGSKKKQLMKE